MGPMSPPDAAAHSPHPGIGCKAFVVMIASMMALNALAIDAMLPALPSIGAALGVAEGNAHQWVVTAYLLGFGAAQIVYGPLADRYGRRPVLLAGLAIYTLFGLLAALAPSFDMLLLARVLQGLGAASLRVLAVSIVRDCYSGRTMARVMSLTFIVFLGTPILAPSLGQLILFVAEWRAIFLVLGAAGAAVLAWTAFKLPETLHPEYRLPIRADRILAGVRETLSHRVAAGYMLAMAMITGALFGFINSSPQIFTEIFEAPTVFPIAFAGIAGAIAVASILNARLVVRLGMRTLSHIALLGFTTVAVVHTLVAATGHEVMWTFIALQAATMFFFGLIPGNFGALSMEPLGHIAGTASSVQGVVTTTGGALIGFFIGQQFDGSTVPLSAGFAVCGLLALGCVLFADRGRLFSPGPARA